MINTLNFRNLRALVSDMDGVLLRGPEPLPGLADLFNFLHRRHIPFIIATNNSTKTPGEYRQKLADLGAEVVKEENILTSALVTAAYLQREFPAGGAVYVVGQPSFEAAIRAAGFTLLADAGQVAEAVVVGGDPDLTYTKLKHAALHIQRGARFIGSNPDVVYPTEEGLVPEAGTILAALQAATGIAPLIMGKPERFLFEIATAKLGSQPAQTVMLGDRLDTDILGGQRAGLKTILMTTGVDTEAAITAKGIQPDAVFGSLEALVAAWDHQANSL
jgi:4-nitrophenyl phosphatase